VGAEVSITGSGMEVLVEAAAAAGRGAGVEIMVVDEDDAPGVGLPSRCPPPENGLYTLGWGL